MLGTEEFKLLAEKHMDMIFRIAFSFLKSQSDAEDVTQDVLLRLYETDYVFESRHISKTGLQRSLATNVVSFGADCLTNRKISATTQIAWRLRKNPIRICLQLLCGWTKQSALW